jgi:hypothetical protein
MALVVLAKGLTPDSPLSERMKRTLGDWRIGKRVLAQHGQVGGTVLGVANGVCHTAATITAVALQESGRVRFLGVSSTQWGHLVGGPSPVQWKPGQAWPVQTVRLDAESDPGPEAESIGVRVARIGDVVVTVRSDGPVEISVPPQTSVTIVPRPS